MLFLTAPFRIISLLITQLFLRATSGKHGAMYLFYFILCLPKSDVNGPLISQFMLTLSIMELQNVTAGKMEHYETNGERRPLRRRLSYFLYFLLIGND